MNIFYFYIIFNNKLFFSSIFYIILIIFPLLSFFYIKNFIQAKEIFNNIFLNNINFYDFLTFYFCGLIPFNIYCILLLIIKNDSIVGKFCMFFSIFYGALIARQCLILHLIHNEKEINENDKIILFFVFFISFLFLTLFVI